MGNCSSGGGGSGSNAAYNGSTREDDDGSAEVDFAIFEGEGLGGAPPPNKPLGGRGGQSIDAPAVPAAWIAATAAASVIPPGVDRVALEEANKLHEEAIRLRDRRSYVEAAGERQGRYGGMCTGEQKEQRHGKGKGAARD
eukprot:gene14993-2856_t